MSVRSVPAYLLLIDGRPVPVELRRCVFFLERLVGLGLGVATHGVAGVWIERCAAIHTLWMRYAIDVAFLGADGRVLRIDRAVPPRRIRAMRGARAVVEAPAGCLQAWGVEQGRRLMLCAAPSHNAAGCA